MTAVLMTLPVIKFTDSAGAPLAGGKVYFFAAGTSTPKDTFTTAAGNVANTNPVILDSAGAAVIFLSGSYKINVTDSTGAQQSNWPVDNVTSFSTGATGGTFLDNALTIQNSSDLTKQATFSLSGLTTGSTRVITVPDGNFTIATKASVDALVASPLAGPGIVSGNYYTSPFDSSLYTAVTVSADTRYARPVYITNSTTITKLSIDVETAQAATNARLGIYANSSGIPGALLLDAGTVSLASTGTKEITGLSQAVTAGSWYFFCLLSNASTARVYGLGASYADSWMLGTSALGSASSGYSGAQAYGALDVTFGTPTLATKGFSIFYRTN